MSVRAVAGLAVLGRALRGNFGPDYDMLGAEQIDRAREIYSRPGILPAGMREAANVQGDLAELTPMLGAIRAPTLVVTAELDRNVAVEVGEATRDAIPGARLVRLSAMAHNFPVSRPAEVRRMLADMHVEALQAATQQSLG